MQSNNYWSGTEYAPNTNNAWNFNTNNGNQNNNNKNNEFYACRKGKGLHAGVKRLQRSLRQAATNGINFLGYIVRFGFPVGRFNHYLRELLKRGLPALVIQQCGRQWRRVQERDAVWRYETSESAAE